MLTKSFPASPVTVASTSGKTGRKIVFHEYELHYVSLNEGRAGLVYNTCSTFNTKFNPPTRPVRPVYNTSPP